MANNTGSATASSRRRPLPDLPTTQRAVRALPSLKSHDSLQCDTELAKLLRLTAQTSSSPASSAGTEPALSYLQATTDSTALAARVQPSEQGWRQAALTDHLERVTAFVPSSDTAHKSQREPEPAHRQSRSHLGSIGNRLDSMPSSRSSFVASSGLASSFGGLKVSDQPHPSSANQGPMLPRPIAASSYDSRSRESMLRSPDRPLHNSGPAPDSPDSQDTNIVPFPTARLPAAASTPTLHHRASSLVRSQSEQMLDDADQTLVLPLPTLDDIATMRDQTLRVSPVDPQSRVMWAKVVFSFVARQHAAVAAPALTSRIEDRTLVPLIVEAIAVIKQYSKTLPPVPEAIYLCAEFTLSGTFPKDFPPSKAAGFRGLEAAGNSEYAPAWYKIGREYEITAQTFSDRRKATEEDRARDAYERGLQLGDVTSTFRLGMAYLQGQLGLARDSARGVQLLRTSAQIADQLADPDTATPLWVWGMLINHEFDLGPSVPLPFSVLPRLDPVDAGRWIKKSAYLHETKAQCRMGTAYEYAQLGLPYDPLMSVQYYSLASQGGSEEADMALSKWFLCGAEGVFSPDEELAYTFAEKAADKGLPSAIFALAYYNEVGLQGEPQLEVAKRFYEKVLQLEPDNEDARERLQALRRGAERSITRNEHQDHISTKLVRKHTIAQQKSRQQEVEQQQPVVSEARRRATIKRVGQAAGTGERERARPRSRVYEHSPAPRPTSRIAGSRSNSDTSLRAEPVQQHYQSHSPSPSLGGRSDTSEKLRERESTVRPTPPATAPSHRFDTFASMGVAETQLKKDDCIIM